MKIKFIRLNHVQICIPKNKEEEARKFYCELLGLEEIEKPEYLKKNGGFWLKIADIELHIGAEDIENKSKRHPAFEVEELEKIKASASTTETSATENSKETNSNEATINLQAYETALYSAVLETESVSSLELTTLAKQRITSIKTQLIEQNHVANEQVFALQPSLEGQAEKNRVITTFNLTTR